MTKKAFAKKWNSDGKKEWRYYHTKRDVVRFYDSIIPLITKAARKEGYAIGYHGSACRDLDCIAVPWVEKSSSPERLRRKIAEAVLGKGWELVNEGQKWVHKPHGRKAISIMVGANVYIDLSVVSK